MRLVIIESPYAGDVERNKLYAQAALLDSLRRGEAPLASHLLYTQVLDDQKPEERRLGIDAGHAWGRHAALVAVYEDLGLSLGVSLGVERAEAAGIPVEYRRIPGWSRPAWGLDEALSRGLGSAKRSSTISLNTKPPNGES